MSTDFLTVATAKLGDKQLLDTHPADSPLVDYLELKRQIDLDFINYNTYDESLSGDMLRALETVLRSDVYLALLTALKKRRYKVIFTMSERAGIPFAAMNQILPDRKCLISMFQSWSYRQEFIIKHLQLYKGMDFILVHCQSMKEKLRELGAPAEQIRVMPYGIDHHFYSPRIDEVRVPGLVLSLGEVRSRDYDLLFKSVVNLPVALNVLASGTWYAREKRNRIKSKPPENVQIRRGVSASELRILYSRCQFVVLPIKQLVYSAGVTAALEAMAMCRAVIVSDTPGLRDFVIDGENGLVVEPGNPAAMRAAIEYLLANPEEARRLGENGRQFVEEKANVQIYVASMKNILLEALANIS